MLQRDVPSPRTPDSAGAHASIQQHDIAAVAAAHKVHENERIVYQLLMQQGTLLGEQHWDQMSLHEAADSNPEVAMRLFVEQQATKAYWDVLAESLSSTAQGSGPARLLAAVAHLRERLLELLPGAGARSQQLRRSILEALDESYVSERLQTFLDLPYLEQLLQFVVHMVQQLEAPARAPETQQEYEAVVQQLKHAATATGKHDLDHVACELQLVALGARSGSGDASTAGCADAQDRQSGCAPSPTTQQGSDRVFAGIFKRKAAASSAGQHGAASDAWTDGHGTGSHRNKLSTPRTKPLVTVRLSVLQLWGTSQPQAQAIAAAVCFVNKRIDQITLDVVKYRLELLKRLLQGEGSGITYLRRRYDDAVQVAHGSVTAALPVTTAWLRDHLQQSALATGAAHPRPSTSSAQQSGVLCLLQSPTPLLGHAGVAAPSCPETLLLEAPRLTAMQNELQRLSLTACSMLMGLNALKGWLAELPGGPCTRPLQQQASLTAAVRTRFLALLADPAVRMDDLVQELSNVVLQHGAAHGVLSRVVETSADSCRALCRGLLHRVFATDDPVYKKVQGAICRALTVLLHKDSLEPGCATSSNWKLPTMKPDARLAEGVAAAQQKHVDEAVSAVLGTVAAQALVPEVKSLGLSVRLLLHINWAVCAPYYEAICRPLAAEE